MKRVLLFMLMLVATIACNSDDNISNDSINNQTLTLAVENKEDLQVGEKVYFSITNRDNKKISATLYLDGKKIPNPHIFREEGTYPIVAKRQGFLTSEKIEVQIGSRIFPKLELKANAQTLDIEKEVIFTVFAKGIELDSGFSIREKESNETLTNNTFKATKKGTYTFIASGKYYLDSEEVTIEVTEKVLPPLTLNVYKNELVIGEVIYFNLLSEGKPLQTDNISIINTQDNTELKDYMFAAEKAGTYTFKAIAEGYSDSNEVVITVLESNNKFTINNKVYKVGFAYLEGFTQNIVEESTGKTISVLKPYKLSSGKYANRFELLLVDEDNYERSITIAFYVENNTIKVDNNNKVTDYGQRILPTKNSNFEFIDLFALLEGDMVYEALETSTAYTFNVQELTPVVAGESGLLNITIQYKSKNTTSDIIYHGVFNYSESDN